METITLEECAIKRTKPDYSGNFHSAEYERMSEEKSHQRELVRRFILEYFSDQHWLRLLSFPGRYWYFETGLALKYPKIQVVGLERSASIINLGLPNMINANKNLTRRRQEYGDCYFNYIRTDGDYKYLGNKWLDISSADYTTIFHSDYKATLEQKKDFYNRFYRRNAVWLDFTCMISPVLETTVRNLDLCMSKDGRKKPVVITFLYGRDIKGGEAARVAYISKLAPGLKVIDCWVYRGAKGTPMITIAGEIYD